ncbi:MAG TPA: STT3 domain-containing protein [Thermoanaerobaculaceae bacterium]|nr:STT3 domain-containing protein [Thermoanaerobaculaceae bacterium]
MNGAHPGWDDQAGRSGSAAPTGVPGRPRPAFRVGPAVTRVLLAVVLLLAAATRLANIPGVFVAGQVLISDEDSAYHWHRALLAAKRYPRVHTFDYYTNFPTGARMMWPIGFDLALATLVRAVEFATAGHVRPEVVGVLFDPLLGVLAVVAVYFLGCELGGRAAGLAGAAIAAVLPILTGYSMVGRIDHHAAEPILAAVPLTLLLRAVGAASARRRDRLAVALGLVMAASMAVWAGSIAPGLLVAVCLALTAVWPRDGTDPAVLCRLGRVIFGVAALAVTPVVLIHPWAASGSFAYFAPTWLQPFAYAAAWLGFAAAGVAGRRWPARAWVRAAALGAVPPAALAAGVALFADLRDTAAEVLGYLGRGDVQISQVFESYPLLSFGWGGVMQQYGVIACGFPVLLAALAVRCGRGPEAGRLTARITLPWFLSTAAMAIGQIRLGSQFVPLWCALWGAAWASAVRSVEARVGHAREVRLGAVLVGVALMAPTLALHRVLHLPPQSDLVFTHDALVWLRDEAASPGDVMRPEVKPRFGVMSRWQFGNWVISEAHQANIANPFAQAEVHLRGVRDAAAFYLDTDPGDAALRLKRLGARYVMVTPLWDDAEDLARHVGPTAPALVERSEGGHARRPAPAFYLTANSRLLIFDGLETTLGGMRLPPLRRLRLDFESAAQGEEPGWRGSFCKVFELVAGAVLEGTAFPGEPVEVRLDLVTNRGRWLEYLDRTTARADGVFALRVPYSTDGGPAAVRAEGPYELIVGRRRALVRVSEADVAQGRAVRAEVAAPRW